MTELRGQVGEVRMTLEITRAATGKTETVELIGTVIGTEETEEPAADEGGK